MRHLLVLFFILFCVQFNLLAQNAKETEDYQIFIDGQKATEADVNKLPPGHVYRIGLVTVAEKQKELHILTKAYSEDKIIQYQFPDSTLDTAGETDSSLPMMVQNDQEEIYDYAEIAPEYPTGIMGLRMEVAANYSIPEDYDASIGQNKIIMRFAVMSDGRIDNIHVIKGIDHCAACNENAIKAIEAVQFKFKPGRQNGQAVAVRCTLPIVLPQKSTEKDAK